MPGKMSLLFALIAALDSSKDDVVCCTCALIHVCLGVALFCSFLLTTVCSLVPLNTTIIAVSLEFPPWLSIFIPPLFVYSEMLSMLAGVLILYFAFHRSMYIHCTTLRVQLAAGIILIACITTLYSSGTCIIICIIISVSDFSCVPAFFLCWWMCLSSTYNKVGPH